MLALLVEGWLVAVFFSLFITVLITGVVACLVVVIASAAGRRSSSTL